MYIHIHIHIDDDDGDDADDDDDDDADDADDADEGDSCNFGLQYFQSPWFQISSFHSALGLCLLQMILPKPCEHGRSHNFWCNTITIQSHK